MCFEFSCLSLQSIHSVSADNPKRRDHNKEQMAQKEHIVAQAAEMFATYGIKAVRMDDIAHELGVSKRTLYELFGDKEELLYQAMMQLFTSKREEHNRIAKGAKDILEAMFMVLNKITENAAVQDRLTQNLKKFYPKVFERVMNEGIEKNHQGMKFLIEEGIREGFFVEWMNIDLTISIFYAAGYSLKVKEQRLSIPKEMSERAAFMQVVTTLFRGISTPKGQELIDRYAQKYSFEK